MSFKQKVLFLLGPTGVGKSSLAIKLAKEFDFEIISADSVQVYKEFDIGSAKITESEMQGVTHYGIDILSPLTVFSASEFVSYTKEKIKEISVKGKIPLIVGGTALYIKSLIEGYNFGGTDRHDDFREEMELLANEKGLNALFEKLKILSPSLAEKIDRNNKIRLIRALEIASFGTEKKSEESEYDYFAMALILPREKLYENINNRTKIMLDSGLIKEVEYLKNKYCQCQPLGAIGYKETLSYLSGEIDKSKLEELISQHTRNYAKRQLTFLKSLSYVKFFDKSEENYYENITKEIVKWIQN